jgi:CheY-like chemotaxis protein
MKFTRHGEVFIGVQLKSESHDEVEIQFEVRDSGIGIPEDKLARLFKPFSQVDSSTTRKYGGTGLGLAISEKLVTLMGGKIDVASLAGLGTSFTFSIHAEKTTNLKDENEFNAGELGGKHILIIDDNKTTLHVIKKLLERWKFVPVITETAENALTILESNPTIDLAITDLDMPQIDGVLLTRFIRKMNSSVPVILVTTVKDEQRKYFSDLFARIITKPLKQRTLFNAITDTLSNKQSEIPTPSSDDKLSSDFAKKFPLRILVAEDNIVNQTLAIRALRKLGYEPELSENGKEAVKKIDTQHFDVILMDIQMPEMDGFEATRVLRGNHFAHRHHIIVAMTANAMAEDKAACFQAGMDDYISKPIQLNELEDVLRKWSTHLQHGGQKAN